uniref:Uncharacterized protein n=1 Tax=Nelumbo nucifera TaxID=4432 RepID=A0A822Y389_NELNU|nr:TPA_asm: hypothetical protein HUJ06_027921 [Nelumbo nucifera]
MHNFFFQIPILPSYKMSTEITNRRRMVTEGFFLVCTREMELGLRLGDTSNTFAFADKSHKVSAKSLGF